MKTMRRITSTQNIQIIMMMKPIITIFQMMMIQVNLMTSLNLLALVNPSENVLRKISARKSHPWFMGMTKVNIIYIVNVYNKTEYCLIFICPSDGNDLVCCENQDDGIKIDLTPQPPQFKLENGEAHECSDHTSHCERWARNDPQSCTNSSLSSFEFMRFSCMKSCKLCGKEVH